MRTTTLIYEEGSTQLEAFVAYPERENAPLVLLCHAWRGRDDFICKKAEELAQKGYIGFALDIYGKGILGDSPGKNAALKKPFLEDRRLLQKRLLRGYEKAYELSQEIVVLGYGFGGLGALDLARCGVPLKGAISVYGHFEPPPFLTKPIQCKILILHGYRDKVAKVEELHVFERELNEMGVDFQTHLFGQSMHAFMNPKTNMPEKGIAYDKLSAARADQQIDLFLEEIYK